MRLILLVMLGCTTPEPEDTFTPSPYLPEETAPPTPEHTPDEVGQAIDAALQQLYALNSQPILSAYSQAITGQDDYCPRYYAGDNGYYWFDQCESEDGSYFSGYGMFTDYDQVFSPPDENFMTGSIINGASSITTPEGYMLNLSGAAWSIYRQHQSQPTESYQTVVNGTFDWDGPSADGTWLGTSVELDLNLYAYRHVEADGRYIYINGGISGLDDSFNAIVFDEIKLVETKLGGLCEQEPHGVISVRGPDGNWYDVLFDGMDTETWDVDNEQCDGIGHVSYRGEALGDIAVDFSELFNYETAPW